MAERTEISWAHSTFNPWIGCTRVSPGCDNCYAATLMQDRYGRVKWGAGEARQRTKTWDQPRRWNAQAAASGKPWRVFCASLADVFDNEVPVEWRMELFELIRETPHLTWMLLTKRIGNVEDMLPGGWYAGAEAPNGPYPNVWLGITVVNQVEANRDIPKLLAVPAAVRWLSMEPLLGPVSFRWAPWRPLSRERNTDHLDGLRMLDWVIVGGESGANARPMSAELVRTIRDQCAEAGVPFHFKQWGGVRPKAGGHLLDGVEHRAFPPKGNV